MKQKNTRTGRGATDNPANRFAAEKYCQAETAGLDEAFRTGLPKTRFLEEYGKTLVNKVTSPDVGMEYSMNPYQGCEHGCAYCYARNTHEYWGLSAGLDFEQTILVKKNAPDLLRKFLNRPAWECRPLSLSGNTDCYQPAEEKFRITRQLLTICHEYHQPVTIITKNARILDDIDLLADLASRNLTGVMFSITSLQNNLQRLLEPRTSVPARRLQAMETLSKRGVPCGVMMGPVIPGLNDTEMKNIYQAATQAGAVFASYTFVRLNGAVQLIFREWLRQHFPDRQDKVWNLIASGHGGTVNDSRFGTRMKGEGPVAGIIHQQFKKLCLRYGLNKSRPVLDCTKFVRPGTQLSLF